MKILKCIVAAAGLFALAETLPLSAQDRAIFTDSPGLLADAAWGTSRTERYDVAVHIALPKIEGKSIESVAFPWRAEQGISDATIWLSRELKVENKKNVPDVMELEATIADGCLTAVLPQPYTVEQGGVYVGMSFTVDAKDTEDQKTPVGVISDHDRFGTGFWVHTSATYGNRWKDLSADRDAVPVFEVTLGGVSGQAVTLAVSGEFYTLVGEETSVPATMVNYGSPDPTSIGVLCAVEDSLTHIDMSIPEGTRTYFGYPVECILRLPGEDVAGSNKVTVSVESVDGLDNSLSDIHSSLDLYVCSSRPVHRPLFEEYTGTGCGFCPRGAMGMERLEEIYGDMFVGIAYHVDDVMSIASVENYPNFAPAQPDAYLDRYVQTDPYFGAYVTTREFGVDKVWKAQERIFAPAHFSAQCAWKDEERTALDITSEAVFVRDFSDVDFRVAYVLVEDGLKGKGAAWAQGNYYTGEVGKWPEEFDWLVEAPKTMTGMTYDHVAIAMTEKEGILGSMPESIIAETTLSHSYSIALADALNLAGESLVQDKDRIHVVAILLDASTGRVLNCAEAHPEDAAVGSLEGLDVLDVEYFTLQGIRIPSPEPGSTVIEIRHLADGSLTTHKVTYTVF